MPPPHGPPLPSLHKSWPTTIAVPAPSGISPSVSARVRRRWHTVCPRCPTRPTSPAQAGNSLQLRGTFQTLCGHRASYLAANRPSPCKRVLLDFLGLAPPGGDTRLMSHQSFHRFGAHPPASGGPKPVVVAA